MVAAVLRQAAKAQRQRRGKLCAYLQVAELPRNLLLPGMEAAQEIPRSKAGSVSGGGNPRRPLRLFFGTRRRCIFANLSRLSGIRRPTIRYF